MRRAVEVVFIAYLEDRNLYKGIGYPIKYLIPCRRRRQRYILVRGGLEIQVIRIANALEQLFYRYSARCYRNMVTLVQRL